MARRMNLRPQRAVEYVETKGWRAAGHDWELRQKCEGLKQQADILRDSLSGVRARHCTLTQI